MEDDYIYCILANGSRIVKCFTNEVAAEKWRDEAYDISFMTHYDIEEVEFLTDEANN